MINSKKISKKEKLQKQTIKKEKKIYRKQQRKAYIALSFLFALIVLATLVVVIAAVYLLIFKTTFFNLNDGFKINQQFFIFCVVMISLIIGYSITLALSFLILRPIRKVIYNMEQLASGNYDVRLSYRGDIAQYSLFRDFSESFNKMAEELQHTDTLSNDFINNFSHEFKTPIVSIAGFAKLLKHGNLTEEQKIEYLNIIEEESLRLTTMATNILNLSKIESQSILTNRTNFNLSEQIRNCFIMLESKWQDRDIDFQLDFDEFFITANEELLKQVWINLIDNAIKYTPDGKVISIVIKQKKDATTVTIKNTGSEIAPEHQQYIFNKFYQTDKSHSAKGNGIGLAIVKKIVELHKGKINVVSGNKKTMFIVTLPQL